jgi:hypothetical protein
MLPSVEVLAMALIAGLYLQDALILLYDNEAVLESHGARGYRIRFGARGFQLAGRNPVLPNPLTPWRMALRLAWQPPDVPAAQAAAAGTLTPESVRAALRVPSWGLLPIAAGLFLGIPLCLYFDAGWTPFLSVLAVMYAATLFVLACLWRARTRLRLATGNLAALTFEALVCLPCALNVLRKATTRIRMAEDLLDVARPRLTAVQLRTATEQIVRRVDEGIESAETGSARWRALTDYRARLLGEAP